MALINDDDLQGATTEPAVKRGIRATWGLAVIANLEDHLDRIEILEEQVGVVSGDDASPLFVATVTLTDSQIKALPTTAIEIVAAPAINFRIKIVGVTYTFGFQHGAYTNVNTTSAELYLKTSAGTIRGGYLANDNGVSLTTLTTLFVAVQRTVDCPPYLTNTAGTYIVPNITGTPVNDDAKALQLFATNNGAGNFTGGHVSNTLTVQVHYIVEAVPTYTEAFTAFFTAQQLGMYRPPSAPRPVVQPVQTPTTLI